MFLIASLAAESPRKKPPVTMHSRRGEVFMHMSEEIPSAMTIRSD